MKGPDVDGRFAEEAKGDGGLLEVFFGKRHARSQRDLSPHYRMAAQKSPRFVEKVHGAALALGNAALLPAELRHDFARVEAARQSLTVFPVRSQDVIVRAKRGDGAHPHRLLADIEVAESANLPHAVEFRRLFLKPANHQHFFEQVFQHQGGREPGAVNLGQLRRSSRCGNFPHLNCSPSSVACFHFESPPVHLFVITPPRACAFASHSAEKSHGYVHLEYHKSASLPPDAA